MRIVLAEKVTSLFQNAEIGDYIRVPKGRLCIVVPRFIAGNGRICNAIMLDNGFPCFFAADEKVEVFVNVQFRGD